MRPIVLAAYWGLAAFGCASISGLDEDYCQEGVDCPASASGAAGGSSGAAGGSSGAAGGSTGAAGGSTGAVAGAGDQAGAGDGAGDGGASGGGTAGMAGEGGSAGGAGPAPPALPSGLLAFYRSAPGNTKQSEMFIATLPSGELSVELGAAFGLCNPRSPAFDEKGQNLVVTAIDPDTVPSCAAVTTNDTQVHTEVYVLHLGSLGGTPSYTLKASNGAAESDPTFGKTASGDFVYFGHAGATGNRIARVPNISNLQPLTSCMNLPAGGACFDGAPGDQFHPAVAPSPELLCYQEGVGTSADIYCASLSDAGTVTEPLTTNRLAVATTSGLAETKPSIFEPWLYYERPIAVGSAQRTFARVRLDAVGDQPVEASLSLDGGASYSDIATLSGDTVVFSRSTTAGASKDLCVGVFGQETVWLIDEATTGTSAIDTADDEAGAAFFPL